MGPRRPMVRLNALSCLSAWSSHTAPELLEARRRRSR